MEIERRAPPAREAFCRPKPPIWSPSLSSWTHFVAQIAILLKSPSADREGMLLGKKVAAAGSGSSPPFFGDATATTRAFSAAKSRQDGTGVGVGRRNLRQRGDSGRGTRADSQIAKGTHAPCRILRPATVGYCGTSAKNGSGCSPWGKRLVVVVVILSKTGSLSFSTKPQPGASLLSIVPVSSRWRKNFFSRLCFISPPSLAKTWWLVARDQLKALFGHKTVPQSPALCHYMLHTLHSGDLVIVPRVYVSVNMHSHSRFLSLSLSLYSLSLSLSLSGTRSMY